MQLPRRRHARRLLSTERPQLLPSRSALCWLLLSLMQASEAGSTLLWRLWAACRRCTCAHNCIVPAFFTQEWLCKRFHRTLARPRQSMQLGWCRRHAHSDTNNVVSLLQYAA